MKAVKNLTFKRFFILSISIALLFVSFFYCGQKIHADAANNTILFSIYATDSGSSSSTGGSFLGGHAWLVIENNTSYSYSFYNTTIHSGETISIGTWGNRKDPTTNKKHNGAWLNLESYCNMWKNCNSLTTTITSSDLSEISQKCISMNEWGILKNCSYFASVIWNDIVASDLQVTAYRYPYFLPSILKGSIKGKDGYQTNRQFDYNDYTGYCTNDTTFKYINPSTISGLDIQTLSSNDIYITSFPQMRDEIC